MSLKHLASVITCLVLVAVACGGEPADTQNGSAAPEGEASAAGTAAEAGTSEATDSGTTAASPGGSLEDLALYEGEDWADVIGAGAAEEGQVTVYLGLQAEELQPMFDAFTAESGVEVEVYSAQAEEVRRRILEEQDAGRYDVDLVFGGDVLQYYALKAEDALQPYTVPAAEAYPANRRDVDQTWISAYETYFVAAYNTDMFDAESAPKTYEEVLSLSGEGQEAIGIEASDVAWYATLIDQWGEEEGTRYFDALFALEPFVVSGHTTLSNLVAAAEIPYALTVYNYRAELDKRAGAPIEWIPLEPAVGILNGLGIAQNAPHPHAALALAEFILSEPGQQMFTDATNLLPSHPDVSADPPSLSEGFEGVPVSYDSLFADFDGWQDRWERLIGGQPTLGG